ncbi:Peroxin 13, N-terminal region-domain-containing protein [Xylaria nigripes]|nr:Peroxin 13, N-terminal region-domain-containing protein [Xylaria nigripes]
MASPPKPWERAGAGSTNAAAPAAAVNNTPLSIAANTVAAPLSTTSTASTAPIVPPRPDSLSAAVNQNASAHSRLATNPYNSAYSSPYSSPYSRMGGMGGYGYGNYGGYGGYGGMYGGGMYGGMPGMMPNDPNNPNSLTNRFSHNTQATFQMLEGIVGAFGGFAQMLESTYMATHSSFFAMVSVAEQFSNLRETLGSVLGIFTLMRWIRTLFAKVTGRPLPADAMALTPSAFAHFQGQNAPGGQTKFKPSKKPLVFFLLAAFGLPYLISKAIRSFAASAEEDERKRMQAMGQAVSLDPSKLEFCRVLYDFTPEAGNATQGVDLAVKKGDFIAVLSKSDPLGNPSEWWRCRARDGRLGYLPATFLATAKRPDQMAAIKAAPEPAGSPKSPITSASGEPPAPTSKVGDISPESFQKSQFYS